MKGRLLSLTLAATITFSLAGYRSAEPAATEAPTINAAPATIAAEDGETGAAEKTETEVPVADFKIGIITDTTSQGGEETTQTSKVGEKYDDMIAISTYPDNLSTGIEAVISSAVAMASDPAVKVIVWHQAIPGTAAAINKVHETRPDIVFIVGIPGEDPGVINPKTDIVLQVDKPGCSIVIPPQAKTQGAEAMTHCLFSRHISCTLIATRHENLKKCYAENGIGLAGVIAPDPTGDSDIADAQQFILEDVPRQVGKYGKDTVSFTTNCDMQESLTRSIFEQDAIYPLQCCLFPFHAFPAALNIGVAGHEADVDCMLDQLQVKADEADMNGKVSTWGVPCNTLFVEADVEYAKKVLEGRTNNVVLDDQVLRDILQECAGEAQMTTDNCVDDSGSARDNHHLVVTDFVTFE